PVDGAEQAIEQLALDAPSRHRLGHAQEPLVALHGPDGEWQVPRPQAGMAESLDVEVGPAQPAAQEPEELVARPVQARRVEFAQAREPRVAVHEVVEVVHQRPHALLAAQASERRIGLGNAVPPVMHREAPSWETSPPPGAGRSNPPATTAPPRPPLPAAATTAWDSVRNRRPDRRGPRPRPVRRSPRAARQSPPISRPRPAARRKAAAARRRAPASRQPRASARRALPRVPPTAPRCPRPG